MRALLPALLALSLLGGSASAATFHVEGATGSGASADELRSTTDLVKAAVNEGGTHQTVDDPARSEFRLRPKLQKLGESYVLSLDKLKGGAGAPNDVIYSSQLKATNAGELDATVKRITRTVVDAAPSSGAPRVGEVTEEDIRRENARRPARGGYTIGLGPAALTNLGVSGIGYYFDAAYAWDMTKAMVRIEGELAIKEGGALGGVSLGGQYFLNDRDTTPYIGGSLGLGAASVEVPPPTSNPTHWGFLVGVGTGYQFLRTSQINLEVGLRGVAILTTPATGMPLLFAFKFAIHF